MVTVTNLVYVILTFGVFSYALWKETAYFRFCEHALLGVTMGYITVTTVKTLQNTAIYPLTGEGQIIYIIPIIFGLLLYTRFNEETIWLSRWPIAVMVGVGMALAIRGVLFAYIINQVKATVTAEFNLNNLLMFLITLLVIIFFTFSVFTGENENSIIRYLRRIGRSLVMFSLGAFFASTALARLTLIASAILRVLQNLGII
jgi:hypothetical protein